MKKTLLFSIIGAITLVYSCSPIRKTVTSDTVEINKNNVVAKPQIADLKIEERKVEGIAEVRTKDYFPSAVDACKALAIKNATISGKCDLLVQPIFEVEENKIYVKVKVIGFAAHYKNFRDITEADTASFKTLERVNRVVPVETTAPKSFIMKR